MREGADSRESAPLLIYESHNIFSILHTLLTNGEKCGKIYPSHKMHIKPVKGKYFGKKCFLLFLIPSLGEHLCDNN